MEEIKTILWVLFFLLGFMAVMLSIVFSCII